MEDIYRALKWLSMAQALDFLARLTKSQATEEILIQLCCERKARIYVDIYPPGAEGTISSTKEKVTLFGIHEVLNPDMAFLDTEQTCVVLRYEDAHWIGLLPRNMRIAKIPSEDIEALAIRIDKEREQKICPESATSSDAALGASIRQQRKDFAERPREEQDARELEYERWRKAGNEIQRERSRPTSTRDLAKLVKARLNLPDSTETIRKRL